MTLPLRIECIEYCGGEIAKRSQDVDALLGRHLLRLCQRSPTVIANLQQILSVEVDWRPSGFNLGGCATGTESGNFMCSGVGWL